MEISWQLVETRYFLFYSWLSLKDEPLQWCKNNGAKFKMSSRIDTRENGRSFEAPYVIHFEDDERAALFKMFWC